MKYTTLKLGQILVKDGSITEEALQNVLKEQKDSGKRIGEILINGNYITEKDLINSLSSQLDIDYIDLDTVKLDKSLSEYVPETLAKSNMIVPIKKEGKILTIAVTDPLDYNIISDVGTYSKLTVKIVISEKAKIQQKIYELYVSQKALKAANELSKSIMVVPKIEETIQNSDQPIVRLVNMMIEEAVILKASDIHIEPQEEKLRIRFRIDGYLVPYIEASSKIAPAVVSRIKFIGSMNIAEKRIPQDGRINYKSAGQDVDLRISSIPSVFGEKIVIRIASALDLNLNKGQIGFIPANLIKFNKIINKDHGIVLITGPTGSGKSTTLYTVLREKRRDDINIITVENPVETIITGITQVEVNTKAGLTFASALRSILRQDPDIVMVGEIRDEETADLAIGAAITGHLVFSTLHTYDASSAVIRLIDMGIEPFMVSAALSGVVSQRLIRKICPKCKIKYEATQEEIEILNLDKDKKLYLYKGEGCEYCNGTGYKGRTAIHEVMYISSKIRKAIYEGQSVDDIKKAAIEEGMITLFENVRIRVLEGVTTYEEMLKLYSNDVL
ncbi:GspE/PulE family protein [Anaerovorax odorimutans]|uniref:GspE/PulE family protein n=1 Tax=Anaerovorax odorimutans TaxID=109327 RepID=UPI00040DCE94|nr:GspE/PulE family protein [Anaerovorax odorimutans]